ncbi:MAG: 3-hydroxyacyl-CoA dehydrogenase family protein [Ginsengibacter sp.]
MKIFIAANKLQENELQSINFSGKETFTIAPNLPERHQFKNFDAYFLLNNFADFTREIDVFENKTVVINEVIETLSGLNLPENFHRINAWPGFLQREIWEIVSKNPEQVKKMLNIFNRKMYFVKDEPGFVSARVISMIINEAFFALGENVSTKNEIDLAMKAGTNYPFGPFEWAEKIGIENVFKLLEKLAKKEERYIPAPALKDYFLSNQNMNS